VHRQSHEGENLNLTRFSGFLDSQRGEGKKRSETSRMNIRDLDPKIMKELALESDHEFNEWLKLTRSVTSASVIREPITQKDVWRTAFSKGVSAVLRRVKGDSNAL
jgi:hypothetical protein